jgi:tripartite-type tricarboxylate transporter receptor subunit TctC
VNIARRKFLHLAVGAAALLPLPTIARAQSYPSRPLRWIIGFPAGGGADTVARIMEPWLSKRLGQPIVIENRPGASTNIAVQAVVNAPPDGYTLLWLGLSSVVNASLFLNLPFDIQRDIEPVAGLIDYPMVMVAHPSVPAATVAELIAYAKANPGKVTMASFGTGSASHLAGELFKFMAGIDTVHVPYRGGAPMIADLVGGQVNVGFDVMVTSLPQIRSGKLRALGVLGAKRFELLPDIQTVAETLPGYEASTWAGIGAPRNTPPEIIARLNREANEGLAQPDIKVRLADIGTIPLLLSPAAFKAYIGAEAAKWDKVVKTAGIKQQ